MGRLQMVSITFGAADPGHPRSYRQISGPLAKRSRDSSLSYCGFASVQTGELRERLNRHGRGISTVCNAIYAKSGNGIVYAGAVRDINGVNELPNFTSFVRYYDPSYHFGSLATGARVISTMLSINGPTRVGHAVVMPGDVVLGRNGGVPILFRRSWRRG
jgi:hypothetical protein